MTPRGWHETPEGFTLPKPLLMPDARSFADVLDYVREWDHDAMTSTGRAGKSRNPEMKVAPRIIGAERGNRRRGNEVGPFCTVDMRQLGGSAHRSIAVRATDATIAALTPRIVTPDDTLSFQVIGHEGTERALIIAQHGYIIGDHWLAYIDAATIPAYPFELRDARARQIHAAMQDAGQRPVRYSNPEPYAIEYRDGHNAPARYPRAIIHGDGSVTRTWPDGTVSTESAR